MTPTRSDVCDAETTLRHNERIAGRDPDMLSDRDYIDGVWFQLELSGFSGGFDLRPFLDFPNH